MRIDDFRNRLIIQRHRLDDELEIQAETQEHISRQVSKLNSRQLELADKVKRVEARLALAIKEDDPKATIQSIDSDVRRHRDRIEAWEAFQEARQEHEEWQGLLSAWINRGYNLKTLADLYGMQYFAVNSAGSRDRASMRDREDRPKTSSTYRRPEEAPQPIKRRSLG